MLYPLPIHQLCMKPASKSKSEYSTCSSPDYTKQSTSSTASTFDCTVDQKVNCNAKQQVLHGCRDILFPPSCIQKQISRVSNCDDACTVIHYSKSFLPVHNRSTCENFKKSFIVFGLPYFISSIIFQPLLFYALCTSCLPYVTLD